MPARAKKEEEIASSETFHRMIDRVKQSGVNFLAVDFDSTLISIHTYGNYPGSAADLSSYIRPFFKRFIPMAIQNGIKVAIVTFSPQTKLIQSVLQQVFPEYSAVIPIRGRDLTWDYQGRGSIEGKQKHMASAAEELNNLIATRPSNDSSSIAAGGEHNLDRSKITRDTTLLLDDDMDNVCIALKNKVRAVVFNPDRQSDVVDDLLVLE